MYIKYSKNNIKLSVCYLGIKTALTHFKRKCLKLLSKKHFVVFHFFYTIPKCFHMIYKSCEKGGK